MHRCDEHVLPRGARPHRLAKNLRTWMRGSHRIPRHAHCNWVWPQQRTPLPKPRARTHDEPPPREPRTHVASKTCSSSLAATLDQFDAHKHVDQLFQLVGPHECCACGRAATRGSQAARCTLAQAGFIARLSALLRGPTYRIAAAIKGSSHRVDLHGTSRVQVHDATRATRLAPLLARGRHTHMKRRGTAAGSAAGRARQVRVHRGAARACGDHSPPKSASLGSIALVRASLHSAAQHSTRQQEARGAHPRTPADSAA